MDRKNMTWRIGIGGSILGLLCLSIGLHSQGAALIVGCAFLGFFAWLGLMLWLRPLLAKPKGPPSPTASLKGSDLDTSDEEMEC
jgi:hypothetical protein